MIRVLAGPYDVFIEKFDGETVQTGYRVTIPYQCLIAFGALVTGTLKLTDKQCYAMFKQLDSSMNKTSIWRTNDVTINQGNVEMVVTSQEVTEMLEALVSMNQTGGPVNEDIRQFLKLFLEKEHDASVVAQIKSLSFLAAC